MEDKYGNAHPIIKVTSYDLIKPYSFRWHFIPVTILLSIISYFFGGIFVSIIVTPIIVLIIYGLLFGWSEAYKWHHNYKCPNCRNVMRIAFTGNDMKINDSQTTGRCPVCSKYHIVDYRYDGNMRIFDK